MRERDDIGGEGAKGVTLGHTAGLGAAGDREVHGVILMGHMEM